MPNYKTKLLSPMSNGRFHNILNATKDLRKKAFFVLLYYYCPRVTEAINLKRKQFWEDGGYLVLDVGKRLKRSKTTKPLMLPKRKLGVKDLILYLGTFHDPDLILFPINRKTAWNWCHKFKIYPHYFILSRITKFLSAPGGKGISAAQAWTGKHIRTLQNYAGQVDIKEIADGID